MGVLSSPIDVPTARDRLDRLRALTEAAGVSAVVVSPGSDLRHLIGIAWRVLRAPHSPRRARGSRALPPLRRPEARVRRPRPCPLRRPRRRGSSLGRRREAHTLALAGLDPGPLAFSDTTTALHLFQLRDAGAVDQRPAWPIVRELRMRKTPAELAELRAAGAAIDRVHARVGEWLRPGRTEREVAGDIAAAIVEEGHARAEFVIVGSGPNGSSPHHAVSDRVIERGDVIVVDIGGPLPSGYCSDSTRTYAAGPASLPDVPSAYAALLDSHQAAVDAVRPGVTCQDVDRAARKVLVEAGLGEHFIHRTGHGIGLDVHEEPYIVEGNDLPLEVGMTFSIEPCIVFPGRWGARIEDIVAVTDTGVERLNHRPRELTIL